MKLRITRLVLYSSWRKWPTLSTLQIEQLPQPFDALFLYLLWEYLFIYLFIYWFVGNACTCLHAAMAHHTTGSQRKQWRVAFSSSTLWIPKFTEPVLCDVLILISLFKCFAEKFSIYVPQVNAHTFTVRMTGVCWVSL